MNEELVISTGVELYLWYENLMQESSDEFFDWKEITENYYKLLNDV